MSSEIRCGRLTVQGPCRTPAIHEHHAVCLHLSDQVTVSQDGRWEVGPGELQLIPAGTPHGHHGSSPALVFGAAFCAACVAAEGLGDLLRPFDAVRRGRSPILRPDDAQLRRLRGLFELLESECERVDAASPRARRALLELLLVEIGRLTPATASGPSLVADALAWLEVHALEEVTPADVAAALGRSPTHLTTVLKARTGQTLGQWIISLRMSEARRRLSETDERIDVVGERVGYLDPSHFSRVFRRAHGVSPTEWRIRTAPARARG